MLEFFLKHHVSMPMIDVSPKCLWASAGQEENFLALLHTKHGHYDWSLLQVGFSWEVFRQVDLHGFDVANVTSLSVVLKAWILAGLLAKRLSQKEVKNQKENHSKTRNVLFSYLLLKQHNQSTGIQLMANISAPLNQPI